MKRTFFTVVVAIFLAVLLMPNELFAQNKENKVKFKFSGFIRNDAIYNTRQVVSARDEQIFLLAPKPIELDANGNDINDASNYNIVGISSRLRTHISLPDAFGAKTSGFVEVDFYGTSGITKWQLRMRHAYVKLNWERSEVLVGQYWHGNFIPGCIPGTVGFGCSTPINPLSRNPQFRFTYKLNDNLSAFAAAMGQGHFKGKSPVHSDFNSGIPELHAQIRYDGVNKVKGTGFLLGAGLDFKSLKPALFDEKNGSKYVTEEKVNSVSVVAYSRISLPKFTIKMHSVYGQNNDNAVQQGGYGVVDMAYTPEQIATGYREYSPYNVLSGWMEVHTNGKHLQAGLFGGFSKNMGSSDKLIADTGVGRWLNVNKMVRITPRLTYTTGKTKLGLELEYSAADYANEGGIDNKGKVINYNKADNYRFIFAVIQSF